MSPRTARAVRSLVRLVFAGLVAGCVLWLLGNAPLLLVGFLLVALVVLIITDRTPPTAHP